VPVEYLLAINEGLVNPNLHDGLSFKVAGVTNSHVVPVRARLIKQIMDILNCIVQVDSQKGISDCKTESVISAIVKRENLRNVTVGPDINRIHAEPGLHCEHWWEESHL
jgi:hypothetical protein